jgi:hypothetical protein
MSVLQITVFIYVKIWFLGREYHIRIVVPAFSPIITVPGISVFSIFLIGAYKIETLPDGQTRGIEVDLMSSANNKKIHSRPTYESITREDIEASLI